MIDFVLFEKKPEGDRPAWTLELAKDFCEDQKYDVVSYEDSTLFVVAKLTTATADGEKDYRLVEITPTLTFLVEEDPSLNEFLEPEIQTTKNPAYKNINSSSMIPLPPIQNLTVEEVKEASC